MTMPNLVSLTRVIKTLEADYGVTPDMTLCVLDAATTPALDILPNDDPSLMIGAREILRLMRLYSLARDVMKSAQR